MDEKLIDKWLSDGTITAKQATKMRAEAKARREDKTSNTLVTIVAGIGSLLVGIGAILFVALNWQSMPSAVKTLILIASTGGALYAGYELAYARKNLPRVGEALLFLGALLWGATVFLVTQTYNIEANAHQIIFVWLLGTLPLVYVLASRPLAMLAAGQFYVWLISLIFSSEYWYSGAALIPFLIFATSITLALIGIFHYGSERLKPVGMTYRAAGFKVAMFMLFLFTFTQFIRWVGGAGNEVEGGGSAIGFIAMSVVAVILSAIHLFINPAKNQTVKYEIPVMMLALVFLYAVAYGMAPEQYYDNPAAIPYAVFGNLLFIGACALLIWQGMERQNMTMVNIGIFWTGALIIARYFNIFWGMMNPWLFFIVGGAILIIGGIALERKRRELRQAIAKPL